MTAPPLDRDRSLATRARTPARQATPIPATATGIVTGREQDRLAATLGTLLHAERTARGWSARHLASRVGATASTVTRLERGERRPSLPMLRALAAELTESTGEATSLLVRLTAAAGASLVQGNPGTERRRARRTLRARQAAVRAAFQEQRDREQSERPTRITRRALRRIAQHSAALDLRKATR
ncbi:multiprotein-bridging factor 1 family protein [Streptomyces erythrochromogenes]|uniref:helix-turn-helix domain-containing protein n=1 Tax=Streptomyces erythrochromogenes TaxID=285574 RepID=UPI00368E3C24